MGRPESKVFETNYVGLVTVLNVEGCFAMSGKLGRNYIGKVNLALV